MEYIPSLTQQLKSFPDLNEGEMVCCKSKAMQSQFRYTGHNPYPRCNADSTLELLDELLNKSDHNFKATSKLFMSHSSIAVHASKIL